MGHSTAKSSGTDCTLGADDEARTDGVVVIGANHQIVSSNAVAPDLIGVEPELLAPGSAWLDVIRRLADRRDRDPDDAATCFEQVAGPLARREPFRIVLERVDGSVIEITGTPLIDGGFVSRQRDVTTAVRQRREFGGAREAHQPQARYFDLSQELVGIVGADGRLQTLNDGWARALGWQRDEMATRPITDFVLDEDSAIVRDALARVGSGAPTRFFAARFRHRNGGWRYLEWQVSRNEIGELCCLGFDATDIQRATEAAESARAEADRLKGLLVDAIGSLTDGFVLFGADDRLVICNETYKSRFGRYAALVREGVTFESLMRLVMQMSVAAGDAELDEAWLADRVRQHRTAAGTGISRTPDGRTFRVSERRTHEGGIVTVLADITELIDREKSLEDSVRELEATRTVLESQAERLTLLAEQHEQEKTRAEQAMRVKTDFLATVSHEFRTPLNGIVGMAELLHDTVLDAQQASYVENIGQASDALLALVNDILDFSKLEAGQVELESVEFDLRKLVEDTVGLLAIGSRGKSIDLLSYVAPDLPESCIGDPARIRQVLLNLIGNAVKFTDTGSVLTRVTAVGPPSSDDVCEMLFEVIDTGIGIPADVVPRLFDRFAQADASTTRRYGGTGLGLAISRELTERMGGSIDVESRHGEGSRFWFRLPLGSAAAARASDRAWRLPAGLRALVVDDGVTSRDVLLQYAADWGISARGAADATAAIDALGRAARGGGPFDVVVIDQAIADIDGVELARRVRTLPNCESIRLVLVAEPRFMGNRYAEFDAVIEKPVRGAALFGAVARQSGSGDRLVVPDEPVASAGRPPHETGETRQPLNVLVVEDNAINQKLACALLTKFGHRYETVANGVQAVAAARQKHFDVILMDIQMPQLDGIGATRQIRALEDTVRAAVPIVAMTANALSGDREKYLAAGMTDYVAKPINGKLLAAALDNARGPAADRRVVASPDAPAATVLDVARIDELVGTIGAGTFGELVSMALDSVPENIERIRQALAAGDYQAAGAQAHHLKGSIGNFGLRELYLAADEIEAVCRGAKVAVAVPGLDRLRQAADRGAEAMKRYVSEALADVA
jgi:PAS domain S-box-containing protein